MKTIANMVLAAALMLSGCRMINGRATVEMPAAETPQDEALSRSVRDRLLAEKKADLSGIKVVTNGGKVYLSGTVQSLDARQQAIKIAWEAPGVQSVVNSLEVQK